MLKIYRAYADEEQIKLRDYIRFNNGEFDTGLYGFGRVETGNYSCTKANYELQKLKNYNRYLQSIKRNDGYVENFAIFNPYNYQMLESKYKDISKDFETYERMGINEEAILLFTDRIRLENFSNDLVQRVFGRHPGTGMYLILPNASFDMVVDTASNSDKENYEVLQSQSLGKRLVLTKMNRKI